MFVPMVFIPIFYFAVFRPTLLNEYALFTLGLLTDLISGTSFGLFSFIFVLLFFIARLNRLFFKELSFSRLWLLFSLLTGLMLLTELFLFALCEGSVVQTKFLFQQATLLILFFPIGVNLCNRLNCWIGTDE